MILEVDQSKITSALAGKLKDENIESSNAIVNKMAIKNNMDLSVLCKKHCINCSNKDCMTAVMSQGNPNADIMYVLSSPSLEAGTTHTLMFGAEGRMLATIINNLPYDISNIYITSAIKCYKEKQNIDDLYICSSAYLRREINNVGPKSIIAFGLNAINALNIIFNKDLFTSDITAIRGTTYNVDFNGNLIKVVQTLDINTLIQLQGGMYSAYKKMIWQDVNKI